ncbi:MAG: 3-hydroxyacyl-CoA dehydrogenase NAD-binding domain-containing protein, partial [Ignavibacteriaceae bacterium]
MQNENIRLEDLLSKTKAAQTDFGNINSVAIIGAGVMGQGIAHTIAAAGMDVLVVEK